MTYKSRLKERFQKLAGIIKEQDEIINIPCGDNSGFNLIWSEGTIISGVPWAPSILGYGGPNQIANENGVFTPGQNAAANINSCANIEYIIDGPVYYAGPGYEEGENENCINATDDDGCEISSFMNDISSPGQGNYWINGMMLVVDWAMSQIQAGNMDMNQSFNEIYLYGTSAEGTQTSYNGYGNASPMSYGVQSPSWGVYYETTGNPTGQCINPDTGNTYWRYTSIQIGIAGIGYISGGLGWQGIFDAINNAQPLLNENYPGWEQNINNINTLNSFLSSLPLMYNLGGEQGGFGGITMQCSAGSSCKSYCYCECLDEEYCPQEDVCAVTMGCADPLATNYNPEATPGNPCTNWGSYNVSSNTPAITSAMLVYQGGWITANAQYGNSTFNDMWDMDSEMFANWSDWFGGGNNNYTLDNPNSTNCGCVYEIGCPDITATNFDENNIANILSALDLDFSTGAISNLNMNFYGGNWSGSDYEYDIGMNGMCMTLGNNYWTDWAAENLEGGAWPATPLANGTPGYVSAQALINCLINRGVFTQTEDCDYTATCDGLGIVEYQPPMDSNGWSADLFIDNENTYSFSDYWIQNYESSMNTGTNFSESYNDMNSFCAACQGEPGANEDFEASSIYGVGCACCDEVVSGCMDETMSNYNPEATWDDGSCYLEGCTDENAENYNELATDDDGSCEYFDGYHGCMDESAFNYNPDAQINAVSADDDSDPCLYLGCIDNGEMVYNEDNFNIITNPGVMDTNWSPFPGIPADNYVGDELAAVGNIVMSESNLINSYVFYGFWDVCTYSGCMDENALN